jgi:hypothetical protein
LLDFYWTGLCFDCVNHYEETMSYPNPERVTQAVNQREASGATDDTTDIAITTNAETADARTARERQEAEDAATMSRQLQVFFGVILFMALCFTLAWQGLQQAISTIH